MRPPHGGNIAAVAREFGLPPESMLDFSANLNPLAPEIDDDQWAGWRKSLHAYPSPEPDQIEERLATVYSISEKHITVLPGAVAGISAALGLFSGRRALIPTPSFSEYPHLARINGLETKCQPVKDGPQLADSLAAGDGDVVLLANPNNPTGDWIPTNDLAELIARAPNAIWIVDEAYADFIAADQRGLLARLDELSNLIVVRSLTKFWNVPGLRLGFLATANADWSQALRDRRLTWAISSLAQPWSESHFTHDVYARMSRDLPRLFEWRDELAAELAGSDRISPQVTDTPYFLISTEDDADELWRDLARKRCVLRKATSWPGLPANRCLRISPRRPEDNAVLTEAISSRLLAPA